MECSTRWAAVWVMTGLGLLACGEETEDPGSAQADTGARAPTAGLAGRT